MADNKETNQLETAKHKIGFAGSTARAFINSPLTPMLIIIFILMGLTGIAFTPRQEDPQISVPMVDIFVQYPGASSEQVAALAAKPLQRIMGEMSGVKHVYAASQRDAAIVTVEFDVGEEMEDSLTKLYSKLDSNRDAMPPGVTNYMVKPKAVDDVRHLRLVPLPFLRHLESPYGNHQLLQRGYGSSGPLPAPGLLPPNAQKGRPRAGGGTGPALPRGQPRAGTGRPAVSVHRRVDRGTEPVGRFLRLRAPVQPGGSQHGFFAKQAH